MLELRIQGLEDGVRPEQIPRTRTRARLQASERTGDLSGPGARARAASFTGHVKTEPWIGKGGDSKCRSVHVTGWLNGGLPGHTPKSSEPVLVSKKWGGRPSRGVLGINPKKDTTSMCQKLQSK